MILKLPLPPIEAAVTPVATRLAPVERRDHKSSGETTTVPAPASDTSATAEQRVAPPSLARYEPLQVGAGQSLYDLFTTFHLKHGDLMQMLQAGDDIKRRLNRLSPGQTVYVHLDDQRRILHLLVGARSSRALLVTRGIDRFVVSDGATLARTLNAQADSSEPSTSKQDLANATPLNETQTNEDVELAQSRLTLRKGQSLYQLFTEHTLSRVDLLAMLRSDDDTGHKLSRVQPGQSLTVAHIGPRIEALRLHSSAGEELLIERVNDRFVAQMVAPESVAEAKQSALTEQPPLADETTDVQANADNHATQDSNTFTLLPAPVVHHELEIQRGESLAIIFDRLKVPASEIVNLLATPEGKRLKRLQPGQVLSIKLLADNRIHSLETELDEVSTLRARRNSTDRLLVEIEDNPLERHVATTSGIIEDSLFVSGQRAGLSDRVIMQLVEIFGWDVDFALDVRVGDRFNVVYESLHQDGEPVRDGRILAAEFVNRGRTIRGVLYTDATGASAYFTPEGLSMRKAFLRTPVNFSRISSRFSSARRHPVLNRIRAHKGVDYAAPRGTPIKAAGNGRVVFSGWRNGYGRTVIIKHGQIYSTLYGHMSRIHSRARQGNRVRQGETIGYVGSTGLATGPHLHYEFRVRGVHKDPLRVKLPKALPIERKFLNDFLRKSKQLVAQLDMVSSQSLAATESSADETAASQ